MHRQNQCKTRSAAEVFGALINVVFLVTKSDGLQPGSLETALILQVILLCAGTMGLYFGSKSCTYRFDVQ